jgi:hypothetical protein
VVYIDYSEFYWQVHRAAGILQALCKGRAFTAADVRFAALRCDLTVSDEVVNNDPVQIAISTIAFGSKSQKELNKILRVTWEWYRKR